MQEDAGVKLNNLKVDGGACANNILMQFQADILDVKVERPEVIESTAQVQHTLQAYRSAVEKGRISLVNRRIQRQFTPQMDEQPG